MYFPNHDHSQHISNHGSSYHNDSATSITAGDIDKAQQSIYDFFLKIIKSYSNDRILDQFNRLFIRYEPIDSDAAYHALGEIIFYNKEAEFQNTLLRCCYILNNNWLVNRNINACQQLVDLFLADFISIPTKITKLKTLKQWVQNFVRSQEYNKLRSLSGRPAIYRNYDNWSERFSTYLLASEYNDPTKPIEQRKYAENLSRKLKKQFKFDLALYTAKIDARGSHSQLKNPTSLGDGVLILIKKVLNKQGNQNFRNIAKNLYKQSQFLSFGQFKIKLLDYLGVSANSSAKASEPSELQQTIIDKVINLAIHQDDQPMTISLLSVTCNRLLRYILLNEQRQPSHLVKAALDSQNFLSLTIILLKIILLLPDSRRYLEGYVAELLKFFSVYSEAECNEFISFLDVLNVTLAIFDQDTDYSLIKMGDRDTEHLDQNRDQHLNNQEFANNLSNNLPDDFANLNDTSADFDFENYRIFSQSKHSHRLRADFNR